MSTTRVYLDHAGCTLFHPSLLDQYQKAMETRLFGNPHSEGSPSSVTTQEVVDRVRRRILHHFNASSNEYCVVFTQNASHAVKIISDNLPWQAGWKSSQKFDKKFTQTFSFLKPLSAAVRFIFNPLFKLFNYIWPQTKLIILQDNHSSITGLRSTARFHGCKVKSLDPIQFDREVRRFDGFCRLFAYPAQSNFNGVQYPLSWICQILSHPGSLILLDAASFSSTNTLDLRLYPADFVVVSFYKIFGFPTGIGALIVRREALGYLNGDHYFAGGTIKGATGLGVVDKHLLKSDGCQFEYGTLPFHEIIALDVGFNVLQTDLGGIGSISKKTTELANEALDLMSDLKHSNGSPLFKFYRGSAYPIFDKENNLIHGPIINFNTLDISGNPIGPSIVQRLAFLNDIHMRVQTFCNPGALQSHLEIGDNNMIEYLSQRIDGRVACGEHDFSLSDGHLLSSIRISFGALSERKDIAEFISFFKRFFLRSVGIEKPIRYKSSDQQVEVQEICIYPIKSCGKLSVTSWSFGKYGFLYDREWMIVDRSTMKPLSQKRYPRMCLIKPEISWQERVLCITVEGRPGTVLIPLDADGGNEAIKNIRVCGDLAQAWEYTNESSSKWLTDFLEVDCMLVRFSTRSSKRGEFKQGFANESPILLVSNESLAALDSSMLHGDTNGQCMDIDRFRGNLIIKGSEPFAEDLWKVIKINDITLEVIGRCNRCHAICNDQKTAKVCNWPYLTLANYRKDPNATTFGIHLRPIICNESGSVVSVGECIQILN